MVLFNTAWTRSSTFCRTWSRFALDLVQLQSSPILINGHGAGPIVSTAQEQEQFLALPFRRHHMHLRNTTQLLANQRNISHRAQFQKEQRTSLQQFREQSQDVRCTIFQPENLPAVRGTPCGIQINDIRRESAQDFPHRSAGRSPAGTRGRTRARTRTRTKAGTRAGTRARAKTGARAGAGFDGIGHPRLARRRLRDAFEAFYRHIPKPQLREIPFGRRSQGRIHFVIEHLAEDLRKSPAVHAEPAGEVCQAERAWRVTLSPLSVTHHVLRDLAGNAGCVWRNVTRPGRGFGRKPGASSKGHRGLIARGGLRRALLPGKAQRVYKRRKRIPGRHLNAKFLPDLQRAQRQIEQGVRRRHGGECRPFGHLCGRTGKRRSKPLPIQTKRRYEPLPIQTKRRSEPLPIQTKCRSEPLPGQGERRRVVLRMGRYEFSEIHIAKIRKIRKFVIRGHPNQD